MKQFGIGIALRQPLNSRSLPPIALLLSNKAGKRIALEG